MVLTAPTIHRPLTPRLSSPRYYTIPYWVEAGFAACALNKRYLNYDTMMLHENLIIDLAAAIRLLREEEGFERIVLLVLDN